MTDYTELVKALRSCAENFGCPIECPRYSPADEGVRACVSRLEKDAADAIEDLKAQLPKRGEWIDRYDEDDKPFFKRKYVCSACSHWNTYGKSKYCPKCGAKMTGEQDVE